jgi:hypothetical protein
MAITEWSQLDLHSLLPNKAIEYVRKQQGQTADLGKPTFTYLNLDSGEDVTQRQLEEVPPPTMTGGSSKPVGSML